MKQIVILFHSDEYGDAEHAKGVLEEELQTFAVEGMYIGKEIFQTKGMQYIFRDIDSPVPQNRTLEIEKLYISDVLKKHESLSQYSHAKKTIWHEDPTNSVVDYVMDAKGEYPSGMVMRYIIENDVVEEIEVEAYRAHRAGYFETKKEAESVLNEQQKEAEEERKRLEEKNEKKEPKRTRRKKDKVEA